MLVKIVFICKKENGGTLRLSSKESEDFFEVTIADDGIGFDPDIKPDDGKLHVGIQNVKQRLHAMCGGTLTIDSRPGEGTIVTIRIPKKKEKTGRGCKNFCVFRKLSPH